MRKEYYGKALPDVNGALNYVIAPNLNGSKSSDDKEAPPSAKEAIGMLPPGAADFGDMILADYVDGLSEGLKKIGEGLSAMSKKNTFQWEL
jgi:hypothetical protein